jgi:hypothetical protein
MGRRPPGGPVALRVSFGATPQPTSAAWPLIGRRHGPRKDRRWATAWSPELIVNRLPIDLPEDETMRILRARTRGRGKKFIT